MIPWRNMLLVAVGSALGGCLRYALGDLSGAWEPWSATGSAPGWIPGSISMSISGPTLFANVTGSLLIGWFALVTDPLAEPPGRFRIGAPGRDAVMVGLLGGYTTFSIFSLETVLLLQNGDLGLAALYVVASMASCLLAVCCGFLLGAYLNRRSDPSVPQ